MFPILFLLLCPLSSLLAKGCWWFSMFRGLQYSDLPRFKPPPSWFPFISFTPSQFVVSGNPCCQRCPFLPLLGLCHLFCRNSRLSSLPSSTSVFCSFVFSKLCSVPIASVSICDHLLFLLFADFSPLFPLVQHICFWFWTWGDYLCEQEDLC